MQKHKCLAGCGRAITWQFAICGACEKKYGAKPLNWPAWLRFLWNDVQRERRQNRSINTHEVFFDSSRIEYLQNKTGEVQGGKLARHPSRS